MSLPHPFLFVFLPAMAVWVASEIPLARETVRRFRKGGGRCLPSLALACALIDLAAAIGGPLWLARAPFDLHALDWDLSLAALLPTLVPVGAALSLGGILLACKTFFHWPPAMALACCLAVIPPCVLLILSPFVRYRLLRSSSSRLFALFALATTYLPLLPVFALLSLHWFFRHP